MHRYIYTFIFCMFFLVGCGPKAVGHNATQAKVTGIGYANDDPSLARYPISGKTIDTTLYFVNTPQYTHQQQNTAQTYIRRAQGLPEGNSIAPNDYNNLQPREASPFRQ